MNLDEVVCKVPERNRRRMVTMMKDKELVKDSGAGYRLSTAKAA
jgi:hypothetical protein